MARKKCPSTEATAEPLTWQNQRGKFSDQASWHHRSGEQKGEEGSKSASSSETGSPLKSLWYTKETGEVQLKRLSEKTQKRDE